MTTTTYAQLVVDIKAARHCNTVTARRYAVSHLIADGVDPLRIAQVIPAHMVSTIQQLQAMGGAT